MRVDSEGFGPRTQKLFDHLGSRVIGQDRPARRIAQGFSIYYSGLKDPNAPIGTYVLAGPTGWGKTLMAEELSRFLIADVPKAPLTRIPCGKYTERHRVSELIGSPNGYVDSDKLPKLAQLKIDEHHFWVKVRPILDELRKKGLPDKLDPDELMMEMYERHRPYLSVVLFDEFEKAHDDLRSAMLHIIGDGHLELTHGSTDFTNSVIVLTCNVGGKEQQELLSGKKRGLGFGSSGASTTDPEEQDQRIYEETVKLIEEKFPPEFVGRIKENIIVYRTLNRDQCRPVLDLMLRNVQDMLIGQQSNSIPLLLLFSDAFKEFLLDEGVDRLYGLRPLKGAIKKHVRLRLANAIERGSVRGGDEVMFKMTGKSPALYVKPRPIPLLLPKASSTPSKPPPGKPGGNGK
ncbi:MAG TPA: AAA family ATPase [Candidatus Baltobacteraceae bacterium]|nr:AAA family ATPase [Candidatus Baltobacteraceae bacterium]